jgi:hypothetical protein
MGYSVQSKSISLTSIENILDEDKEDIGGIFYDKEFLIEVVDFDERERL